MGVAEAVVADDVLGGDLCGELRLAADVRPWHEEGCPDSLAVEYPEQLLRKRMAGPVVEGERHYAPRGLRVPEDRTVEPRAWREPLVNHQTRRPEPDGRGRDSRYGGARIA